MSRFQPWYVRDPENGIEECSSAKEAKSTAEGIIQSCTEDGHWPAEIECLQWGRLVAHEVARLDPGPERNGEPTYGVKLVAATSADALRQRIASTDGSDGTLAAIVRSLTEMRYHGVISAAEVRAVAELVEQQVADRERCEPAPLGEEG